MPKRNKIELQGLVERIIDMYHNQKMSQREIARILKKEGYDLSKSGVGNTLQKYAQQKEELEEVAQEAAALLEVFKKNSGTDIAEATNNLLQTKMMEAVKNLTSEDFDNMDINDMASVLRKNTQNQVQIAKVRLDYEKGYKQGLFRALEEIEKEAQKAGISKEGMSIIKTKLLGLEVGSE